MTENEKKNLKLARTFLLQEEDQKALDCYLEVYNENGDNPEASYFVYNSACTHGITDTEESNKNKKTSYIATSKTIVEAMKYIAESDESLDDKLAISAAALGMYLYIIERALQIPFCDPSERIELAGITLYEVGDAIEKAYNSDRTAMEVAVKSWKEAVKVHQKFYAYKYGGRNVNEYVAKIQKIEPDYAMPKKAGCVTLG